MNIYFQSFVLRRVVWDSQSEAWLCSRFHWSRD